MKGCYTGIVGRLSGRLGVVAVMALGTALSLGMAGCGEDAAVATTAEIGDDALGGAADGTLGQDGADGTAVDNDAVASNDLIQVGDAITQPDILPGQAVCGDGVCTAPDETMFLCAADCKTPATDVEACKHKACQPQYDACGNDPECVAAAKCQNAGGNQCIKSAKVGQELQALQQCVQQANCVGGGLKNCGNGTCDADESNLTCPADCKAPVDPQETCLQKACPAEFKACQGDAACVKVVDCLQNNPNNQQQCVQGGGGGGMTQALQDFFQCAQQSNCFGGGQQGGGGGTSATCGNGQCDQGETMLTCPADCKQPKTQTEACYHNACPKEYAACSADPACVKSVDCFNTGGNPQQCGQNSNQDALDQCIQGSGCNGGGGGGNPPGSCQGKCGVYDQQATCQCDNQCLQNNDCCGDFQTLCAGGGTPAVCGNGTCEASETAASCPKDCGPKACTTKNDCGATEVCCAQAAGAICVPVGQCQ